MEVAIIFEPNFDGEAGPAVWIIGTQENRKWFERQRGMDPGSAVFTDVDFPIVDQDVVQTIWTAQEHHAGWTRIRVIGHALSPELRDQLADDGLAIPLPQGFVVSRN